MAAAGGAYPPRAGETSRQTAHYDMTCANCGTPLVGPYCAQCGQSTTDHLASLRAFAGYVGESLFQADSRALSTVRRLMTSPGALTRDYLGGARVRYLAPLQIYGISAAILFLVGSFYPLVTFNKTTHFFRSGLGRIVGYGNQLTDSEVARLAKRGVSMDLFAERFLATTTAHLSTFLVVSVPVFALVVALAFVRSRRPLTHHVVFALHWSAFSLLLVAVSQLPSPGNWFRITVDLMIVIGSLIYLVIALRRVYEISWVSAVLRGLLLYVAYQVILVAWLEAVVTYARRSV